MEEVVDKVLTRAETRKLKFLDLDVELKVRSSTVTIQDLNRLIDTLIQTVMSKYEVVLVEKFTSSRILHQKFLNTVTVSLQEPETHFD